jgi:uncharacterized protein YoaH (UPF0181 family)
MQAKVLERIRQLKAEGMADPLGLRPLANEIVREFDRQNQGGEWKFHQAFAKLKRLRPEVDGWQIGLAIHLAIARERNK